MAKFVRTGLVNLYDTTIFDMEPDVSSRILTREGFLHGKAALTRTGVVTYDAAELGVGPRGKSVRLMRTPASVFHPETIASAQRASLIIGHPKGDDGYFEDLNPETWRSHVIGDVIGTPSRGEGDVLESEIVIKDAEAIEKVQQGIDGLSIGQKVHFNEAPAGVTDYDYVTNGKIMVNHVGIVPREKSRAGEATKIYDQKPEEGEMSPEEIKKAVDDALAAAAPNFMAALGQSNNQTAEQQPIDLKAFAATVGDAVSEAVKPSQDKIEQMATNIAEQKAAVEKAERERGEADAKARADQKAKDDAAAFEQKIRAEERDRANVVADALPMIPESKRDEMRNADTKDILVAAVGDSVPDPENQSEAFLKGALEMKKKILSERTGGIATRSAGVGDSFDSGASEVQKAREEYEKTLAEGYKMTPS